MIWSYEMVKLYRQKWQCIRDENGRIVAWCAGYSDDELKNLLKRHPGWYFSGTFSGAKFE